MAYEMTRLLLLFFAVFTISTSSSPCAQKSFGSGRTVCVCNTTYCDQIEPIGTVTSGQAVVYTSSKNGKRLERTTLTATDKPKSGAVTITVDQNAKKQQIMGFGGAFTDAVGINLKSLPEKLQDQIIDQYFSPDGLGYVFGRVPMASCDFSTHEYSYDDVNYDFAWTNFNLTIEDFDYKIPFIKKAMVSSKNKLQLFATPWSAPGWMKSNGHMKGGGTLLGDPNGQFYVAYAQYFVKFFEAYHNQGVDFWAVTPQNEPMSGLDPLYSWQTMYFSAAMERDFIKKHLGPALKSSPISQNVTIMISDDQRYNLPTWPDTILQDPIAAQYVSGIAVHWYEDFVEPATVLNITHTRHPDYFILATEACAGYEPANGPTLGSWSRAEQYANDLIKDIGNYVSGWVDWNLVLDMKGGPNWVQNYVDAAIIVDANNTQYFKQPIWHVMAHFSKFVPAGSSLVATSVVEKNSDVETVAFANQDGTTTLVVLNKSLLSSHYVSISTVAAPNNIYTLALESNSIVTVILK